jgi:hypothetical protein
LFSSELTEAAMNDITLKVRDTDKAIQDRTETPGSERKLKWETPKMEDVSEQVTAQPYIRFT